MSKSTKPHAKKSLIRKAQWKMKTPWKNLFLVASEDGLHGVYTDQQDAPLLKNLQASDATSKILSKTVKQLEEYFQGRRQNFDLPLVTEGTTFQRQVWSQLSQIPFGETCTYAEIARRLKKGKAFRAVGNANGKNPHCIIVPCHRVIASDGTLGGYSSGLDMKRQLLRLEKAQWKDVSVK